MTKPSICLLQFLLLSMSILGQGPNPLNPARPAKPVASEESQQVPGQGAGATPQLTSSDLDAFLDGIVPLQVKQGDIAGATVAVVKDGKLLLARGYGFADVDKKKPVSPGETLFRCGSISKLF